MLSLKNHDYLCCAKLLNSHLSYTLCTRTLTCIRANTHAHACTHAHTRTHMHTCKHARTHMHTHAHAHAHAHAHTCKHTRMQTHTHTTAGHHHAEEERNQAHHLACVPAQDQAAATQSQQAKNCKGNQRALKRHFRIDFMER